MNVKLKKLSPCLYAIVLNFKQDLAENGQIEKRLSTLVLALTTSSLWGASRRNQEPGSTALLDVRYAGGTSIHHARGLEP
jgi:hypothetical protein